MIAGMDLGGTRVRVAVAGPDGRILSVARASTPALGGPQGVVGWAAAAIDRLAAGEPVTVVGVGTPGPIDAGRGLLVNPPNLPGWRDVPLVGMLAEATGAAVHLGNDANLAALGELHQGAGRGASNLVYVTWSTGIGSGLILDGRLYSGAHGTAGEVGHMVLEPEGPACTCGQRGCLESLAAGHGIAAAAGRPAAEVFRDAARGDAEARRIVAAAARYMGLALINLANLVDPEVIVVGGGIAGSWGAVRGILLTTLRSSPFIGAARRPRLVRSRLGGRSGLVGAVEWARAQA